MTIEQFAKMREWLLKGNTFDAYIEDSDLIMFLLATSKCPNECELISETDKICRFSYCYDYEEYLSIRTWV